MIKRFRPYLLLAIIGLVLFSIPGVQAASKTPEIGTNGHSRAEQAQKMAALHARLTASPHAAIRQNIALTAVENDILDRLGVDSTGRFRVGVHRAVSWAVSNKGTDLIVRVQGAQAVRLELTDVKGTVSVFNNAGEAHEYTEDGFTHTFWGEEVQIRGSVHVAGAGVMTLSYCGSEVWCLVNATCAEIDKAIPQQINSVRDAYASILFISGPYYYVCSGGLIADSDDTTNIPYFLTANHCIDKTREALSVETFFQYTTPCENDNNCSLWNISSDTVGSTIMATGSDGDFTLLELKENPPTTTFLGWNSDPVADTNGTQLYRISHPGGLPQAYSEHEVDTTEGITCRSWPRGERIYSRDTLGATAGGSSGSPVLNTDAQIVGQLSGACGTNVYDECDPENNATVDGAFAYYYPKVKPFLGEGTVSSECVESGECDDSNPCTDDTCDSGQCINTPNGSCPSTCLLKGEQCDPEVPCCSGSCHPVKGTCK
ncbi:trypsin-like serine peptidase [Desulforhopalus singaporensis]|uniref:V8-like Glu-specific endopeptidase n=1 Tax=Desulforhopalus singaporensis TaxID=91360 RepID=A0A1H0VHH8_9BACT|nr:serine protease [Desulforhopalus singaporensis]SDP77813.1 V8-like Glu-specific endopeptidase [Desulforhopalus singaporensis]